MKTKTFVLAIVLGLVSLLGACEQGTTPGGGESPVESPAESPLESPEEAPSPSPS